MHSRMFPREVLMTSLFGHLWGFKPLKPGPSASLAKCVAGSILSGLWIQLLSMGWHRAQQKPCFSSVSLFNKISWQGKLEADNLRNTTSKDFFLYRAFRNKKSIEALNKLWFSQRERDFNGKFLPSSWFAECQAPKASCEINTDFQVIKPCTTSLRILCGALFCFHSIPISTAVVSVVFFFLSTSHSEKLVFSLEFVNKQLTFPRNFVWRNLISKRLFLLSLGWMKNFCPED